MTPTATEAGKPAPTAKKLLGRAKWLQTALVNGKYPYGTPDYNYIHLAAVELVDGLDSLSAESEREQGAMKAGLEAQVEPFMNHWFLPVEVETKREFDMDCKAFIKFATDRLSPKAGKEGE